MLVLRYMWASGERGGVFLVGFACLKERCPILIEQHQHLLTDLRWQRLVRFMRLHAAVYLVVVEVLPLMNEGLSYLVQSGVVQILGLECCFVNHAAAWVMPVDAMLLNQLHTAHLLFLLLLLLLTHS